MEALIYIGPQRLLVSGQELALRDLVSGRVAGRLPLQSSSDAVQSLCLWEDGFLAGTWRGAILYFRLIA